LLAPQTIHTTKKQPSTKKEATQTNTEKLSFSHQPSPLVLHSTMSSATSSSSTLGAALWLWL
jgi:hypothetical protein